MDCGLLGPFVHGILQARILEWVAFPTPGDLPDPGIEPTFLVSRALAGGFFTTEPPGKPSPVSQQYNLIPKLNVYENVELPLLYSNIDAKEREKRVRESLEKVGLLDRKHHMPNQLSGGQQQRVSIARALATHPSIILADEPTGALDSKTGKEILIFLKQLNAEGNTVVLITHDNSIAEEAKRVIRLQDGKIVSDIMVERGA